MKTIRVSCKGAGTARLADLHPFQAKLKNLSEENFQKCKNALTGKHGFSFPFFVWRNKGRLFVLDGHQRDKTLKRLEKDGWKIPPLPVDYIEARNKKEAKEKILLLSSRYGEMTDESFEDFIREAEIDLATLSDSIALPEIDLEEMLKEIEGKDEKGKETLDYQYQVIVDCESEEAQLKLLEKLERQKYKCRALIL